jgi:hypothetical protein
MALKVASQPNNLPTITPVSTPPTQPSLAPTVQTAPAAQPQSLPVQTQPTQPQQPTLPVENQPANQQQSLSVALPPIVAAISQALGRGADPNQILAQIQNSNPDKAPLIQTALSRGATPGQVLQEIIAQNTQDMLADPKDTTSFLGSAYNLFVKPILHTIAWAPVRVAQAFAEAAGVQDVSIPDNPIIGAFDSGPQKPSDLRKELGSAIKTVSLGLKNPTLAGATFGFGDAQEQNQGLSGTIEETAAGALGGKAGDLLASGASKLFSSLVTGNVSGNIVNSLIKPLAKEFRFGKNPGLGVAQEKIVSDSLPGLEKAVSTKLSEIGDQIGKKVAAIDPAQTADYSAVLKPFDDAIQHAAEGGPNNQTLITRLTNTKDALQYEMEVRQGNVVPKLNPDTNAPVSAGIEDLNAAQGNALKQKIGGFRKWTGNPSEDTVYNQAVTQAYRTANDIVESQAPGIKSLNSRYANLLSAKSSIERQTSIQARQGLLGTFDKLGLGAAAIALAHGNVKEAALELGLALANHTLGSTAIKTRVAAALSAAPDLASRLFEANPDLQAALQTAGAATTKAARYVGSRFGARVATGGLGR